MAKKKNSQKSKKKKFVSSKTTIQELEDSRDGGQIALRGFTYQFLYSCYLILSELDAGTVFNLEGIEDIDQIKYKDVAQNITHIQIKYSTKKQDASFMKDVLKNFLEAYLLDNTRNFKLIYDFPVAKGNLSKLFAYSLDDTATLYWDGIIEQIKAENPHWSWTGYALQDFLAKIAFEKREKNNLANEIEIKLIKAYDITTDNISIFANSIKICCLEKMEQRTGIDKLELDRLIQSVKDGISKGPQNPAHNWIKRLDFHTVQVESDLSYFEGKKATPQDIALQLPVRRLQLEREIKDAIQDYRVTVIKAPSGQGKTTLALQVSLDLQNEYTVYQILWCSDTKELGNIVQFFKSRVRLGEKPLILIDNLNSQLREWNRLAQLLQEEVSYHYKVLLTAREDDWYSYGGDLSNVRAVQTVKLALKEIEAQEIFEVLRKAHKLHPSILDWRKAWAKVADRKLLIEYIYLLTHGEMLSERIAHQISIIGKSNTGGIKCEILRKVCFADICGIKLPAKTLIASLSESAVIDYGEILKSIENEFLIRVVDTTERYIEGLHPVRSQHIVDRLHEFMAIDDTALQVAQISDARYLSKLFSNLPQLILNKDQFYIDVTEKLWNSNNLSNYVLALRGLFSGSVMQYFHQNRDAFDDANERGGLFIIASELNPFTSFEELDISLNTLDDMKKSLPNNSNIQYLCGLRDKTPKLSLDEMDIYYFCKALYNKLEGKSFFEVTCDVTSYSTIAYWLYNINSDFNLSKSISLQKIWDECEKYSLDVISSIMYTCFCGDRDVFLHSVQENLQVILTYLKAATRSLKIYISEDNKTIHVEYILLMSEIKKGNEESVSRLKNICKTLPIFDQYCADAIMPTCDFLSGYKIPDNAHKTMPIRNIVIMFHQEFASLWSKTIMSNYELDTIAEWLEYWFSVRRDIITLLEKSSACICKLLQGKQLGNLATGVDTLRGKVVKELTREKKYPNEDRPFEEKAKIPEGLNNVKNEYFQTIKNFCNQFAGFICRDADNVRLVIVNLRTALDALDRMQAFFEDVTNEQRVFQKQHAELCVLEEQRLEYLLMACLYYKEHQPSKYFNKYQIKFWYKAIYKEAIQKAISALSSLSEEHFIIFPEKYYCDGVLNLYPIIVLNFDVAVTDVLMKFLYDCIPFTETIFDYLVVLFRNNYGEIMPTGLRVSKTFLTDLKKIIETDDEARAEELTLPFPIDVTAQMLECFEHKYEIFTPIVTGYEGIDRVGELLWAYSKTQELLFDKCDAEYRDLSSGNLKSEILKVLESYKQGIPQNDYEELRSLCEDVFNGRVFDDASFNEFCEKIILESKTAYSF